MKVHCIVCPKKVDGTPVRKGSLNATFPVPAARARQLFHLPCAVVALSSFKTLHTSRVLSVGADLPVI